MSKPSQYNVQIIHAEAAALERSYWEAVGEALELGILVYHPGSGGQMKALGDLRDEIRAERERRDPPPPRPRITAGLVQAYCRNGHRAVLWGNSPMMAKPGEQVRWWGAPFRCHCGAGVYGGYPHTPRRDW